MAFNIKSMLTICCLAVITLYLFMAAKEDEQSFAVTRIKHLIGFIPAEILLLINIKDRFLFDIGVIAIFVLLCLLCGVGRIYGMTDGFVFTNLTLAFGGIGGVAGIGLVILVMILACFSGMIELLLRKMMTLGNLRNNIRIAFVPHIMTGYVAVMATLLILI